jgi:hypothetical protein
MTDEEAFGQPREITDEEAFGQPQGISTEEMLGAPWEYLPPETQWEAIKRAGKRGLGRPAAASIVAQIHAF